MSRSLLVAFFLVGLMSSTGNGMRCMMCLTKDPLSTKWIPKSSMEECTRLSFPSDCGAGDDWMCFKSVVGTAAWKACMQPATAATWCAGKSDCTLETCKTELCNTADVYRSSLMSVAVAAAALLACFTAI